MSDQATILNLTKCLLESIVDGNWEAYAELCDPNLTCFEPEANGCLVEGMDFHRYYFTLERPTGQKVNTTLASPHIRILGDVALINYVRLTQRLDASGVPHTHSAEESRVWQRQNGAWKMVHFHRSPVLR